MNGDKFERSGEEFVGVSVLANRQPFAMNEVPLAIDEINLTTSGKHRVVVNLADKN